MAESQKRARTYPATESASYWNLKHLFKSPLRQVVNSKEIPKLFVGWMGDFAASRVGIWGSLGASTAPKFVSAIRTSLFASFSQLRGFECVLFADRVASNERRARYPPSFA